MRLRYAAVVQLHGPSPAADAARRDNDWRPTCYGIVAQMRGLHPEVDGSRYRFRRSSVGRQRKKGCVQRSFVAVISVLVLGGCTEPGPSRAFDHVPPSEAGAIVDSALRAEQQRDCGRVYQLLSDASRRQLFGAEIPATAAPGAACNIVSPQVAYEPGRSRWEIKKTTVLEVGRVRVDVLVYGRECLESGCLMPFFAVEEARDWRLDLLGNPSPVPSPITTLVPR